jgi:acyl dehydratase
MREEMSRRLTRAIWRRRLATWGPALVLALAVMGAAAYLMELRIERMDPAQDVTTLAATVLSARRLPSKANVSIAHLLTENGEEVDADSQLGVVLQPTERVTVSRVRHASGKVSFHVVAVLAPPR